METKELKNACLDYKHIMSKNLKCCPAKCENSSKFLVNCSFISNVIKGRFYINCKCNNKTESKISNTALKNEWYTCVIKLYLNSKTP